MPAGHRETRVLPIKKTQRSGKEARICSELRQNYCPITESEAFLVAQPIWSRNLAPYPSASCGEATASSRFVTTTSRPALCGPTRE